MSGYRISLRTPIRQANGLGEVLQALGAFSCQDWSRKTSANARACPYKIAPLLLPAADLVLTDCGHGFIGLQRGTSIFMRNPGPARVETEFLISPRVRR